MEYRCIKQQAGYSLLLHTYLFDFYFSNEFTIEIPNVYRLFIKSNNSWMINHFSYVAKDGT